MNLDDVIVALRSERARRSVTQAQVAKTVGASVQYVSQVESRVRDTTFDKLERWASVFGWHLTMALVPTKHAALVDLFIRAIPAMTERQLKVLQMELQLTIDEAGPPKR